MVVTCYGYQMTRPLCTSVKILSVKVLKECSNLNTKKFYHFHRYSYQSTQADITVHGDVVSSPRNKLDKHAAENRCALEHLRSCMNTMQDFTLLAKSQTKRTLDCLRPYFESKEGKRLLIFVEICHQRYVFERPPLLKRLPKAILHSRQQALD